MTSLPFLAVEEPSCSQLPPPGCLDVCTLAAHLLGAGLCTAAVRKHQAPWMVPPPGVAPLHADTGLLVSPQQVFAHLLVSPRKFSMLQHPVKVTGASGSQLEVCVAGADLGHKMGISQGSIWLYSGRLIWCVGQAQLGPKPEMR